MKLFTIVLALTGLLCINADDHDEVLEAVIKVMTSAPPYMCAGIDGTQALESIEQLATLVNSTAVQTALGPDANDIMELIANATELLSYAEGIQSLLQNADGADDFVDALVTHGYVNATDAKATNLTINRNATLAAANAALGDFAEWRVHDLLKMMLGESYMRQFRNQVDERLENLMEHVTVQTVEQFKTIWEDMMHTLCFLLGRFGDMHAAIEEVKEILTDIAVKRIEKALEGNDSEERQLSERRRRAASASGEKQLFERRLLELIDRVRNNENKMQRRQGPGGAGGAGGAGGPGSGEENCPEFDEDAVAEALKPKALAKALKKVENALEILRFVASLDPEREAVLKKARCNYFDKAAELLLEVLPPPPTTPATKRAFMIL